MTVQNTQNTIQVLKSTHRSGKQYNKANQVQVRKQAQIQQNLNVYKHLEMQATDHKLRDQQWKGHTVNTSNPRQKKGTINKKKTSEHNRRQKIPKTLQKEYILWQKHNITT